MPGRRRLWTYSARPVTFSHDSSRGTERPTCGVSVDWLARFMHRPCEVDPQQLPLVRRRAVQIAFDLHFVGRGFTCLLQEFFTDPLPMKDLFRRREPRRLVGRGAHHDAHLLSHFLISK